MNYELTDEEIEENKKFLGVKPKTKRKKVIKKSGEPDSSKITKEVGEYIKDVVKNIDSKEDDIDDFWTS